MTSPNGKVVERIQGACEQVNAKQTGVKVLGEWLNISQYHPIAVMPTPGELVDVQVERSDRGAWIKSLVIVGGSPSSAPSNSSRDRAIARMSALRSAAIFLGHASTVREEVKSDHVLVLADRWLRWLEQADES